LHEPVNPYSDQKCRSDIRNNRARQGQAKSHEQHRQTGQQQHDAQLSQLDAQIEADQYLRTLPGGRRLSSRSAAKPKPWISPKTSVTTSRTAAGIWSRYDPVSILSVALIVASVLAVILLGTAWAAGPLDFSREDEIAAVFCGSKKSLASGAPIAAILLAGNPVMGMIMLPVCCITSSS
jgi:hypothetical protein